MKNYEAYKNKEFDLSAFGVNRCDDDYTYFCTPVGAEIIGCPGVDGIHYCMVAGFGELVFAISPMNCPGDVGRILRTFKIKKNVEVTDNGKIII